jgi:hypothetical protein
MISVIAPSNMKDRKLIFVERRGRLQVALRKFSPESSLVSPYAAGFARSAEIS